MQTTGLYIFRSLNLCNSNPNYYILKLDEIFEYEEKEELEERVVEVPADDTEIIEKLKKLTSGQKIKMTSILDFYIVKIMNIELNEGGA